MSRKLKHLDLFSGIGGFALGLESTGLYETAAFCEIEPFPRRVLKKHWPDVPIYEDVRNVGADGLAGDGIGGIGILTGGFPCQDISLAGQRAGLSGERSGLWSELFRVLTEVRPRWFIAENVPGLRTLGGDKVLADLAGAGYAAWPLVVGAVHAGAPHRRQRVWIVAHDMLSGLRSSERGERRVVGVLSGNQRLSKTASPNRQGQRRQNERKRGQQEKPGAGSDGQGGNAPHANGPRLEEHAGQPGDTQQEQPAAFRSNRHARWDWHQAPEPVLRGVADGLPCGMDRRKRLKALGNAVVPQVVASIGRAIIAVGGA